MIARFDSLIASVLLSALAVMPGCAATPEEEPDAPASENPDEANLGEASLAATVTRDLQNGVAPSSTFAGAVDTTLRESQPTTNEGASPTLTADYDDPPASRKHTNALVRFDVSTIPAGSKVTSVKLTLNVTNRTTGSGYSLYALSRAWSESQATWNLARSGAAWATPGAKGTSDRAASALASLTPSVTGKTTVTFTAAGVAAVQRWVDSAAANYGFVVDTADNADGLAFDSSNASVAANRPKLSITYTTPATASPYPIYTQAEVDAWSTSSPEYARLAGSWAGNVNRAYTNSWGPEIDSVERDMLKDESVYLKVQAVLFAADGNAARKNKIVTRLNALRTVTSWKWDSVEQYRLVAGWSVTNLAQAASIIGYRDAQFTRFLRDVCYPIMDWTGGGNWHASFADSKLATAVYLGDAALYADAKAYFYRRIAQSIYHSAYDGTKVNPLLGSNGAPSVSLTKNHWGAYWGAASAQLNDDFTFKVPSQAYDGTNAERTRDLGHVNMGLGAWMHGARTILAHGDTLDRHAADRLRAAYAYHGKRVISYMDTGATPAPQPVNGNGGPAYLQSWFGAKRLFGSSTPAEVVTLTNRAEVKSFAAGGANHLVAEAFADGP